ncbi:MAG: Gfo/Idh/MocA family protein [Pirellulaceae bacterium]
MHRLHRRDVLKSAVAGGVLLGCSEPWGGPSRAAAAPGPNTEVRLALIGLGGIDIPDSVGGRGRQLLAQLRKISGARVVALCDVDEAVLGHGVELLRKQGQEVARYGDMRHAFDDPNIDAVVIATPNHWHALATIWACQAGKDVYVEKPFSYNIWEGRQMVAAARKFDRMVQVGTQRRSSQNLADAIERLRAGELGSIRSAHALVYRVRSGIGRVDGPTAVPKTLDFNTWSGPAPVEPIHRKHLHYHWHWFWSTGNGEIGNNGPHTIDVARWALGQQHLPPRAISIGGRFGAEDNAETANTQIAFFDYQPAPLICEVRNLRRPGQDIGKFRGARGGVVIQCEGGYYAGDADGGAFYDRDGKKIKDIRRTQPEQEQDHLANFIACVQSRKREQLNAEAEVGHVSAACCHMANISYRLGKTHASTTVAGHSELTGAWQRCADYLVANGVDLKQTPASLGPWVDWNDEQQQFVGDTGEAANRLSQREYRQPFEVPRFV